jgi:hypothetical protein
VAGFQVLHKYKCHAGVWRERVEQLRERFEATRRSPDSHNREDFSSGFRSLRRRGD